MRAIHVVVRFRSPETGGRPQLPVGSGYSPHARTDVGAEYPVILHGIPASARFEEDIPLRLEYRYPDQLDYSPLESGNPFDLLEGARVVATGFAPSPIE